MSDRKFKVSPGDEIIIRVPAGKKPNSAARKPAARKAMVRARRSDDPLPRRLKKGGIKFFDLGYWKLNGLLSDVSYVTPSVPSVFAPSGEWNDFVADLSVGDGALRDDQIFSIPFADWSKIFQPIKKDKLAAPGSSRYRLSVEAETTAVNLRTSDKFSNDILKLSGDEINGKFVIKTTGLFFEETINLTNDESFEPNKITAVRDYAAPAVPFTPSASMTIFLLPRFVRLRGRGSDSGRNYLLNMFWSNHSREQFLTHHTPADPLYAIPGRVIDSTPDTAAKQRTIAYHKQVAGSRTLISEFIEGSGGQWNASIGAGAAFPETIGFSEFVEAEARESFEAGRLPGLLAAVVFQNGNWFYVWND